MRIQRAIWWTSIIVLFIIPCFLRVLLQNQGVYLGAGGTILMFTPFAAALYFKHRSFKSTSNYYSVSDEEYLEIMKKANIKYAQLPSGYYAHEKASVEYSKTPAMTNVNDQQTVSKTDGSKKVAYFKSHDTVYITCPIC
jgi:hypothetical protein